MTTLADSYWQRFSTVAIVGGEPGGKKTGDRPFGVYILTYPGDFHLSTVLVRSIRQVSPDAPIMIIPGERFDRADHPFDVPVMPVSEGFFWPEMGHLDRKFWAFRGRSRPSCTWTPTRSARGPWAP